MKKETQNSMAEMPESNAERGSRKFPGYAVGASSFTARRTNSSQDNGNIMEAVVARNNMMEAYKRVTANKGSAGIDEMEVQELNVIYQIDIVEIPKLIVVRKRGKFPNYGRKKYREEK
jgi:hypothetical protein